MDSAFLEFKQESARRHGLVYEILEFRVSLLNEHGVV